MGDPKKRRKKYDTPRHPWQEDVLAEELRLIGVYGLRNKRELWRHKTDLSGYRNTARSLLGTASELRSKIESELIQKLYRIGLVEKGVTVDDVLDLKIEDILERRLQTVVSKMSLAKNIHQARQLINHGHIYLVGKRLTSPSYIVNRGDENKISYSPDSAFTDPSHPLRRTITEPTRGERSIE